MKKTFTDDNYFSTKYILYQRTVILYIKKLKVENKQFLYIANFKKFLFTQNEKLR